MIDLFLDLLITAAMLLALYGYGRAIRRIVPLEFWNRSSDLAFSLGFGLGIWATVFFILALLGFLKPAVAWISLTGGLALAGWQWHSLKNDSKALYITIQATLKGNASTIWIGLWIAIFILLNVVGDLAPPIEGDTIHQYLLVPRYWVEAGRYLQPSHIWAATLPGNMMMLSAWALLLRPSFSLAALVTGFGISLFFILGVYMLARQYFSQSVSMVAAAIAYTMPDAAYLAQSAKVDMGWAFFEALTLAAFFRWHDLTSPGQKPSGSSPQTPLKWLILSGVCLGWAAGSKSQALISIAILGVWILLRPLFRQGLAPRLVPAATFAASITISAAPYYLYNLVVHRNPFYPVFADLFFKVGGTFSPRSELGTEVFYPWNPWGYIANLWGMSVGHPPEMNFYLGFIVGPVFMILIPAGLILGAYRRQPRIERMALYAFVFSILWFVVKQAARHFLPGLMLLAIIAAYAFVWLSENPNGWRRAIQILAIAGITINFVSWIGVFYWSQVYKVALGIETRADFLERYHDQVVPATFPDWETVTVLNTLVGGEGRVASHHATNPLYITPDMISTNWGDRRSLEAIMDTETMLGELQARRIGYILVYRESRRRHPVLDDPGFLSEHAEVVYEGARTILYRLDWVD